MRKSPIKPETMEKVWKLHTEEKMHKAMIAYTLDISVGSVERIINIMTTAQNGGDVDAIDEIGRYRTQKDFAKKFFGSTDKQKETPNEQSADDSNVATFMLKVVELLTRQNELLAKLCKEWGAE